MSGMRVIAGSGRSGTTWVLDALASANSLRPVFEPLHPYLSEVGARYAYRALSANDHHPDLEQFLLDACAGRRIRLWTKYRRQLSRLFPPPGELRTEDAAARLLIRWRKFLRDLPDLLIAARRRDPLLKCIRANLMLGWLARRSDCRIVLVVRHPGAVIESELRGEWNAEFALNRFKADDWLHELTGNRYRALLERPLSPIEALAVRWVIENQWPVEQAATNGVTVVHYERLKSSPDTEWQRVCSALDLPCRPEATVLARPSQQSAITGSAAIERRSREPRWLDSLSKEQVDLIQRILDRTQFDLYSMIDPEPNDDIHRAVRIAKVGLPT